MIFTGSLEDRNEQMLIAELEALSRPSSDHTEGSTT